jgi:hypothetical protein
MAFDFTINTGRGYGVEYSGFSADIRPGVDPSSWVFRHTYAWPVPHGPQPITLAPAMLQKEWETTVSDTGPYARYKLSRFDVTRIAGASIKEYPRLHEKDWAFLISGPALSTVPFYLKSLDPLGLNEGLALNLNISGASLTNKLVMQIFFGHTKPSLQFALNLFEDGTAELTRATGTLQQVSLATGAIVPQKKGGILNKWIRLFILPHGRNRILVHSNLGAGLVWEDTNIPQERAQMANSFYVMGSRPRFDPTTPVDPVHNPYVVANTVDNGLWFSNYPQFGSTDRLPPAMKPAPYQINCFVNATVQVRPIAYVGDPVQNGAHHTIAYEGTLTPRKEDLITVVGTPLTLASLQHRTEYDALGFPSPGTWGTDPYTYEFTLKTVNAQSHSYNLTPIFKLRQPAIKEEDYHKSPQFYRHEVRKLVTAQVKINENNSLYADGIELSHRHDKDAATGKLRIRNAQNYVVYRNKFNIPFAYEEDGNVYLQSYLIAPKYIREDANQFLEFDLQDEMKFMNSNYMGDLRRLDGLGLDEAVKEILVSSGFPIDGSMWVIDSTPVTIDGRKANTTSTGPVDLNPTNLADVYKTAGDWLRYLRDTYTSAAHYPFQWVMGFAPYLDSESGKFVYKFFFRNPDVLAKLPPSKTWFPTQAMVWGPNRPEGVEASLQTTAYRDVYSHWSEETIEPEFNSLLVVGLSQDFDSDGGVDEDTSSVNDGTLLRAFFEDRKSFDASLPMSQWSSNHLGWRQQAVLLDGSLNTQKDCNRVGSILFERGSRARIRASFRAEWEPSVRMWDNVSIWNLKPVLPAPMDLSDSSNYEVNTWTVTAFSVEHVQENTSGKVALHRPATYYVERAL